MATTTLEHRRHTLEHTRHWDTPVVGLMMRREWTSQLIARHEELGLTWVEIFPENYMRRGASILAGLRDLARVYPITSHGVHLSIGDDGPLSDSYTTQLRSLLDELDAPWCSDHLGASVHGEEILHEILPIPFNEATLAHIAARASEASERLGRTFLLENAAYYLVPPGTTLSEVEFFRRWLTDHGGSMLLDVNNLWVNATNHGYDVDEYLDALPLERVVEIHIGGFTVDSQLGLLIDTHGAAPSMPVWRLLRDVLARTGPRPVLLEWESRYPSLDAVMSQFDHVHSAWNAAAEMA